MSDNRFTIDFDDAEVRAALDRIASFGDKAMELFLRDAGEEMINQTRWRAEREEDPQGIPWVPLSDLYQKRKDRKKPGVPILKHDFFLLYALGYEIQGGDLYWGSWAPYGRFHQEGTRFMPKREWLGVSDSDRDVLLEMITDNLSALLEGR